MTTKVYGSSDDLIEIEGDDITEEFYLSGEQTGLLGFSDGTVLRVTYTDKGIWRITPVVCDQSFRLEWAPENDDDNYSDLATINTNIEWVIFGDQVALKPSPEE